MAEHWPDSANRRGFFQHLLGEVKQRATRAAEEKVVQHRYVRPPGAAPEVAFLASCTRCGLCAEACPYEVIRLAPVRDGLAARTPYLEPELLACEVCETIPCAAACPTDALTVPDRGWEQLKLGRVVFNPETCITFAGQQCRVCIDACPIGEPALSQDAQGHPVLKREGCVGCGICIRDCVSSPTSFTFVPLEP